MEMGSRRTVGDYVLVDPIGVGGMASVYVGRRIDGAGPPVAIKRLHDFHETEPALVAMLHDEARLVSRIVHPNVVRMIEIIASDAELSLVLEYVHGEALSRIVGAFRRLGRRIPPPIASAVVCDLLRGLHAAHCATGDDGAPLGIVHRDVSPQNVVVGIDGVARVLDFGIAKAVGRIQTTREGQLKGKLAYMAPEQLGRGAVSARTDVYAAGIVLWELLVQKRLFDGENEAVIFEQILLGDVEPPRSRIPDLPAEIDAIALRALDRDPEARFATAAEMADALERCIPPASRAEVGAIVVAAAGEKLAARAALIAGAAEPDVAADGIDEPTRRSHAPDVTSTEAFVRAGPAPAPRGPLRRGIAIGAACVAVLGASAFVVVSRAPGQRAVRPSDEVTSPIPAERVQAATSAAVDPAPQTAPAAPAEGDAPARPSAQIAGATPSSPPRAAPTVSANAARPARPARRNDGFDRVFR